jgi:hypothetical protein
MRRPGGFLQTFSPEGMVEQDTFTCKHCNSIVVVKPFADPASMGGRCTCCDGLICPKCVGKDCVTIEQRLEFWEKREAALRSYEACS